ncbi:MAG: hypothetical protein ACJ8AI_31315 [Rhodopila sp.]|jgi:hypothetical protein
MQPLVGCIDEFRNSNRIVLLFSWLRQFGAGFGQPHQQHRSRYDATDGTELRQCLREQPKKFPYLSMHRLGAKLASGETVTG